MLPAQIEHYWTRPHKEIVMKFISTIACALALSFAASSAFAAETPAKSPTPQQQKMKDCNGQATGKKGDERRAFMSSCLKGGTAAVATPPAAPQGKTKAKSAAVAPH
jgi:psiF repeat-containing protein